MPTLYEILGVTPDALKAVIKQAYKRLAMKYHPDRGGDVEMFKQVQTAYDVLSDTARRAHYDATGSADIELSPEEKAAAARRAAALQMIRGALALVLQRKDEKCEDLLALARAELDEAYQKINKSLTDLRGRQAKAAEAAGRAEDEEGTLRGLLQSLHDELTPVIANGENEMVALDLALSILAAGTYRVDVLSPEEQEGEMRVFEERLRKQVMERLQERYGGMAFRFGA